MRLTYEHVVIVIVGALMWALIIYGTVCIVRRVLA